MKLADVIGALRRRWYIVLVSILAATAAAYGAWAVVPAEYGRAASQLLLPGEATIPEDANPYLYVGGLYQVADILVRSIGPDDVAALTDGYPGSGVAVTRDTAAGAVMLISVTAESEAAAGDVLDRTLDLIDVKLAELQEEQRIPADERVDLVPLTHDSASVVGQKNRILMTGVAGVGVFALGIGATVLIDTMVRSRRRARSSIARRVTPRSVDDGTPGTEVADPTLEDAPDEDDAARAADVAQESSAGLGGAESSDPDASVIDGPPAAALVSAAADKAGERDLVTVPAQTGATTAHRSKPRGGGTKAGGRGRPPGARRRNWQAPPVAEDEAMPPGRDAGFGSEREAG